MDFTTCPYDGTELVAENVSGGSVLLGCEWCSARWEWHNAWIRRVVEPDRDRVIAVQRQRNAEEVSPS